MVHWRVAVFYATLLVLLVVSGKPLWWLPIGSLAFLLLTLPSKRLPPPVDWHLWHPVLTSLSALPYPAFLSRWVRYRKIIGGDSLQVLPTANGASLVLLDLSKNDVETLLHFVWARALLTRAWGAPKARLLRLLSTLSQQNQRVVISYLVAFLSPSEVEWHSNGCFGVAWFSSGTAEQKRILPTLGQAAWRARRPQGTWVFTTDGIAPHLAPLLTVLRTEDSPEPFVRTLPREDDLTVGWFASKLMALSQNKVTD